MNTQIIGIMLVKNEERFFDRIVKNTLGFCDKLIVADNFSTDTTSQLARAWAERDPRVVVHPIAHPRDAHELVRPYFGTPTWMLAVDGDEIYDPAGLAIFRTKLLAGDYDKAWLLLGNVLNCVSLDETAHSATGYLAPPCRSMTKLYNFGAITDWTDVTMERMLGGKIHFRPGWSEKDRVGIHETLSWNDSYYRCLHMCFMPRSSVDRVTGNTTTIRLNPVELQSGGPLQRVGRWISTVLKLPGHSRYKMDKYMRGERVTLDVRSFFSDS